MMVVAMNPEGLVATQKKGRHERVEEVCGKVLSAIQGMLIAKHLNKSHAENNVDEVIIAGEAFCESLLLLDNFETSAK